MKMDESYPHGYKTMRERDKFLLFPQCFQKAHTAGMLKSGLVWERVKTVFNEYGNSQTIIDFCNGFIFH